MSIRFAILGFLSWKPFTGYELKKMFADALSFHWSGNNNQIYGSLIELHKAGAVTIEVRQQAKLPAQKIYSITSQGRSELRAWLLSPPELPLIRSSFRSRLAWAQDLTKEELEGLLEEYRQKLEDQILMYRETIRRSREAPNRSPREELIWRSLDEGAVAQFEAESAWLESLRSSLAALESGVPGGGGNK